MLEALLFFSMGSPENERRGQAYPPPSSSQAPPSPPMVLTWDYLNFFDAYDGVGYQMNYPSTKFGYGSKTSSPDSSEVREREGIPDLEDETDPEALKVRRRKKVGNGYHQDDAPKRNVDSREGTSKSVPKQQHHMSEGLRRTDAESTESVHETVADSKRIWKRIFLQTPKGVGFGFGSSCRLQGAVEICWFLGFLLLISLRL